MGMRGKSYETIWIYTCTQEYVVSSFGRLVDQYAISFVDDERQKRYKKVFEVPRLAVEPLSLSETEIDAIVHQTTHNEDKK